VAVAVGGGVKDAVRLGVLVTCTSSMLVGVGEATAALPHPLIRKLISRARSAKRGSGDLTFNDHSSFRFLASLQEQAIY
jgi:hypothetical protein